MHVHLKKVDEPIVDICKKLKREIDLEKAEMAERLKVGGVEALGEEERLRYETQQEIESELARLKEIAHQLVYTDLTGIDSR